MNQNKWLKTGIIVLFMVFLGVPTNQNQAQATSNLKCLETNKKYSYDLNKDGKKESIYFYDDDKKKVNFSINGKKHSIKVKEPTFSKYTPYLVTLADGKRIINITITQESDENSNILLSYSNGVPILLKQFQELWQFFQYPIKVKGNVIYYMTNTDTPRTGMISYFTKFKVSGNTVKQIKTTEIPQETSKKTWTAIMKFKTYTKMGGKKVAFTVNKGDKVQFTNISASLRLVYIKIKSKDNRKSGWIKIDNSWQSWEKPYFEEIRYIANMIDSNMIDL